MSSTEEISLGVRLATDPQYAYNTLTYVFDYLDLKDLQSCARVSSIWRWVVSHYVGSKHIAVHCCETHLEALISLFSDCLSKVVVRCEGGKAPTEIFKSFCESSTKLVDVTLLNCGVEHLKVMAKHLVKVEKFYGFLIGETPLICLDVFDAFKNFTQLELDANAEIKNAASLSELKQLKNLTLTSRFGESTWLQVLYLEKIESLCIYGDYETYYWKTILFEQGHIVKFQHLKTLKLVWYSTTYYLENHIFMKRIKDIENLTQLTLIGVFIDARTKGEFSDYLSKCKNLQKLTIKFGMMFSSRMNNHLINNMHENCELFTGVLGLANNLRKLCWIMPPSETSIQLVKELFYKVLHTYNVEPLYHAIIRNDVELIVSIPPKEFENALRKVLPNCTVFVQDAEDCRDPDSWCLVCEKDMFKRNFLDD